MAATTSFAPRSPERLIRGRGFTLLDVSSPDTPLVLGLVKSFELTFGSEVSRFITLDGDRGTIERPPVGQVTFTRLVGPSGLPRLVCDCRLKDYQLTAGVDSCSHPVDTQYILKNAKVASIAVNGSSEDWLMNYNIVITFTDME